MLSARILAELSEVSQRDARAAVDPRETDNLSELAVERVIVDEDWERADYLDRLAVTQWRAALMVGWQPCFCPWLSDEDNEMIRNDYWDQVLP